MPDPNTPYVEANPGDLITSEKWNDLQRRIRKDIGETTQNAVDQITHVQGAGNADKLEGKSLNELTDEVVRRAVQQIRAESGYMCLFKVLQLGEDNPPIKHNLHLFPLVDLYQLDYFQVVCCEDKEIYPTWTTFYLHHSTQEDRVRYPAIESRPGGSLSVQPERGPQFQIPFRELLSRYNVKYTDKMSLSEVESAFWDAFNSAPNHDKFSEEQYCHSPWFDKCCRDEKTIGEAKDNHDWERLVIGMRPRKTVNYPAAALVAQPRSLGQSEVELNFDAINIALRERRVATAEPVQPAPTQMQVTQYDFDTLGLTLLSGPVYPAEFFRETNPAGSLDVQFPEVRKELKLMVLLKV